MFSSRFGVSALAKNSLQKGGRSGLLAQSMALRRYGNVTQECKDHLAALGITNKNIVFNPS